MQVCMFLTFLTFQRLIHRVNDYTLTYLNQDETSLLNFLWPVIFFSVVNKATLA